MIYFTTKTSKLLWIIDLDHGTFQWSLVVSGAFNNQLDQVACVLATSTNGGTGTDEILYFCKDGTAQGGVHGRDSQGKFFTILQSENGSYKGETTGLAFSPDGMFMYVPYQKPGIIFEIKRKDGLPFQKGNNSTLSITPLVNSVYRINWPAELYFLPCHI
jgi:secreted PhoX family phosphatase